MLASCAAKLPTPPAWISTRWPLASLPVLTIPAQALNPARIDFAQARRAVRQRRR